tara:strand:- start:179199 stop:181166 length:1968 start_codon:yes stop_codon:yes gene_type:complete
MSNIPTASTIPGLWIRRTTTIATVLCASLAIGLAADAQDDPFATAAGPSDLNRPPAAQSSDGEDLGPPDTPLSEQLKLQARRGDLLAADSISALARIGRWHDVDRLLAEAAGRTLNDQTLAAMGDRIEPAVLMRIRLNQSLSEPSRTLIDKISLATKSANESPKRLRDAITKLGSDSRDVRAAGLRELASGGRATTAELIRAIVADKPVAPRDDLLRALQTFGPDGVQGLRQLALYGQPEIRTRAIGSLVRLGGQSATIELITALHAADATDDERSAAANHLVAFDANETPRGLIDLDTAIGALQLDLQRKRQAAKQSVRNDQFTTLWSLNDEGDGVTFQDIRAVLIPYREAADAAARLRRVGIRSTATTLDALNSDLGYRVMIDPDWGDDDQRELIADAYPIIHTVEGLSNALENAIEKRDDAALLGLIRLVSHFTGPADAARLLNTASTPVSPLVRASDHAIPSIRFEAAAAIASLNNDAPYAGSSRVRRTLGEMQALGDLPTSLLLETRPEIIVQLEGLLSRIGHHVEVVGSGAELERRVAAGGDLRLIVSKTGIADMSAVEMADRVRRTPRGRELPILLYGSPSPGLETDRWLNGQSSAPIVQIDRPVSTDRMIQVRDLSQQRQQLPALSSIDRQRYQQIASDALANLAGL